jgi:hypothetical protein
MSDYNMGPYRINPKGQFDPTKKYKYLDSVKYNGSYFVNIYKGGETIGILPSETDPASYEHWAGMADKGDTGERAETYDEFTNIENGIWDYLSTDKIFIPRDSSNSIVINNTYNGCCGLIVSALDLELPYNSDKAIDFDYIKPNDNQYYLYTFTCIDYGTGLRFIWNRKVIDKY